MSLSQVYDMGSIDEAIVIAESQRGGVKALSGGPKSVARYNIWTEIKRHLQQIKNDLEAEL